VELHFIPKNLSRNDPVNEVSVSNCSSAAAWHLHRLGNEQFSRLHICLLVYILSLSQNIYQTLTKAWLQVSKRGCVIDFMLLVLLRLWMSDWTIAPTIKGTVLACF
jgi:hypothetical protein